MILILHRLGPPVGDPTAMYAPSLRYKREALAIHKRTHRLMLDSAQAHPNSSNTAHSGRRVLRSGGPNHSKPAVFIMFFQVIELVLANPRVLTLWVYAGALRHPAVDLHTTTCTFANYVWFVVRFLVSGNSFQEGKKRTPGLFTFLENQYV